MRKLKKISKKSDKAIAKFCDYSRISYLRSKYRSKGQPNAVFIWIPKTAGTSIWNMLKSPKYLDIHTVKYRFSNRGIVTFGHMDYSELLSGRYIHRRFDKSALKFTFVRNPYARTVSLYTYLVSTQRLSADETFLGFCRLIYERKFPSIGLYNVLGLSQCNPQIRWIENLTIDYIGKVESITKDLNNILTTLRRKSGKIPHANQTTHTKYGNYYCHESKEIVEDLYKEDFSSFNYQYEDFPYAHSMS